MSTRDYPVFLLAGQSNMAGRGSADAIPRKLLLPASEVLYDFVCSFGADRSKSTVEQSVSASLGQIRVTPEGAYASLGFTHIAPCRKHPSTPGAHFGPEIGFAFRMSELLRGEPFAIIKHGRGGTNLHTDWRPEDIDTSNGGGETLSRLRRPYRHMVEQVETRMVELRSLGRNPYLAAFVWYQGEGDTLQLEHATRYEERLGALLTRLRADFGVPELPSILSEIAEGADVHPVTRRPWMVHSEIVRSAIYRVAESDRRADKVKTRDLQTSDLVHLDSEGLIEVGRRMADACFRFID